MSDADPALQLQVATRLLNATTSAAEAMLPELAAEFGAAASAATATTPARFLMFGRLAESPHSMGDAARRWANQSLTREPPAPPSAPKGMAGADGEIVDRFIRNLPGERA